jgi:hypothetical protein
MWDVVVTHEFPMTEAEEAFNSHQAPHLLSYREFSSSTT